nr:hypothetical protein [uncultured Holophaga sp.]
MGHEYDEQAKALAWLITIVGLVVGIPCVLILLSITVKAIRWAVA